MEDVTGRVDQEGPVDEAGPADQEGLGGPVDTGRPDRADNHDFGLPLVEPGDFLLLKEVPEAKELPTKDIFINIILDKDEGISVGRGRYTTWTCLYFVHKEWLEVEENRKKLASRFPVFAITDFPEVPFSSHALKPATHAKLEEIWPNYYQVIPITNMYQQDFKTVGVTVNQRSDRRVAARGQEDEGLFEDDVLYELPSMEDRPGNMLFLCVFGTWFQGSALETRNKRPVSLRYSEKWSEVAEKVQEYINLLGPARPAAPAGPAGQEVNHEAA